MKSLYSIKIYHSKLNTFSRTTPQFSLLSIYLNLHIFSDLGNPVPFSRALNQTEMCGVISSQLLLAKPAPNPNLIRRTRKPNSRSKPRALPISASSNSDDDQSTTLVTFLGKGGSGKTTSAVLAAQHYAMAGLSTCLVLHAQDLTAEFLLNCKIGTSPIICSNNLSAVRLETTQMLLEPLSRLKEADARLNMTQGVLGGVVGEELGVLPGMDSIFSAFALERFVGLLGYVAQRSNGKQKFDVIVYDGISSEETLRMMGASSKARLYLKYLRNVAEKTDLGRLAGPSLIRLVDEALSISGRGSVLNGNLSAQIWDAMGTMLERGSSAFAEPNKFRCFLVMDPKSPISVHSALRYWGCTLQAGAQVAGAFGIAAPSLNEESAERIRKNFSPLPFAYIPHLSMDAPLDWNAVTLNTVSKDAHDLFSLTASHSSCKISPVKFDVAKKSVTLLMPGFDKSEIKLYQYRGGSELLVEAGDQRRVIHLPPEIHGKVGGAKFLDRSLIVTMR